MSASHPSLGRRSPASLTGRHLPASPRSSTPAKENLLHLLDLVDREDDDSNDDKSLLDTPSAISSLGHSSHSMMARTVLPSKGMSPVPVFATPVRTGGKPYLHWEGAVPIASV